MNPEILNGVSRALIEVQNPNGQIQYIAFATDSDPDALALKLTQMANVLKGGDFCPCVEKQTI